jgi:plastocyanin
VPAAHAATSALSWNEEDVITFDAPTKPGTYEYICRPHTVMMKGTFRVVK